ncbi:endonuclease/exonuclease/phosphatase family protein [Segetibacter sp.]|jgi:endonuclease/exonuclease/phosphatase family metal-dependent hydrolase|uniref:endonuclease/exonuclease/phosphatase family protein n=1 Tax=Segetibacter sp. TaxID=2231182 RepID=UPI0026202031|nr:endonuclease/exonuclease/phosphatase family protein [Segetibacter sp.]MCW3082259.1 hypothetical protein [Segetibacter sp.]
MKKFFFTVLAVITLISALAYFASCFTPYISPVHFWPMAFLALGFPYLAAVILILAFLWLFIRRQAALFLILLFFVGFQNLSSTFALNPFVKSTIAKDTGSLRILTWNVKGFDNPSIGMDTIHSIRKRMFDYIAMVNPDVLCVQEFAEHYVKGTFSNTEDLKKMGYLYVNRTDEINLIANYGTIATGSAIFSKTPIIASSKVLLGDPSYTEYLTSADISFQNKTIRIFSTHFKSLNLFANPSETGNRVRFYGDSNFVYLDSKFSKLKSFAQAHSKEALIAKSAINKSPFPVIIGTDMNSVPTSYPYRTMSANLQDAFKLKGCGLGATMDSLPKTLRIDFLFIDKKLSIKSFGRDEVHLSDHFPQFVDVKWKE